MTETSELNRLRAEVDRAYSQLAEITSRLLAMNEAGDLLVSTHDQKAVAAALLEVSARTVGVHEGAVLLSRGEGSFTVIAAVGLDEEQQEALGDSLADFAICQLVEEEQHAFSREEAAAEEAFRDWVAERLEADPEAAVEPTMALFVPVAIEGQMLAVLALAGRADGAPYKEEERTLLDHLAEQAALALDRAMLFAQNADRLQDLSALLRISREVTSTLDLDRVLFSAVNTTAAIVERERAVLALDDVGKLVIRAVSDFPRVDGGTADRLGLTRLLAWLALRKPEAFAVNATEADEDPEIEGREVLLDYFTHEMRALLVTPLKDDQGLVGYLLLESFSEGSFTQSADRDTLTVLAGQLTVAIRNAQLYRQLPMVGALAPLAERRRRWKLLSQAQRRRYIAIAAVLLIAVALIPWPRAVAGDSRLLPAVEVPVRSLVAGFLRSVEVRPGQRVEAGQLLARMEQAGVGARLAGLRAEAAMAREQSVRAEKERDAVGRRLADLRRQETLARLAAAKQEDRGTDVVAPVDGFVLTPTLADREGAFLEPGDVVCEVSPLDTLRVEVAIDETEIGDVRPGERLRVKVLGYPDRQFQGRVSEVSWQGEIEHKGRPAVFLVRGWVENPGGLLKSGMTGRARIEVSPTTLLWRWTKGFYRVLRLAFWF